ncbi:MAG TPA: VCBS repeat-containing protein, partial [Candidatus Krumholzibacterium sp.]|nr:VCBS repeat-containing protein [Candidatus Krumholzibacterium sp.]
GSAGEAAAEKDEHFSISTLSVADDLLHIISRDLDADGLSDILAIHRKGLEPDETRWLSVFLQSEGGSFSTAPDQSWEIDTMAVVVDTGQLDGDPAVEICYLSPDGVMYYDLIGDRFNTDPKMLIRTSGLTVFPSKRRIPAVDFVKDWNDDGVEEVGIFRFEGISIFSPGQAGSFTRENRISVELLTNMYGSRMVGEEDEVSGLRASFSFPATRLIDHDNDGRKDLIAVRGDRLVVYPMLENGEFAEKPSVDMMFDVRTQQEKIENTAFAQTVVDDLNNDGFADAVVTKQSSRGLSNFRCAINIYYGRVEGFRDTPDQVIISEGSASEATILRDVNGDGRLDMILPSIEISIKSIVRFLLTRSVPINFN